MRRSLTLRPVRADDEDFLVGLFIARRSAEFTSAGWDENTLAQFLKMQFDIRRRAYAIQYPSAEELVAEVDGNAAAQVTIKHDQKELLLVDIVVDARFRGRGIASDLIRDLQLRAARTGVPMVLHVEKTNSDAERLYAKLGFLPTGESELHRSMKWRAPTVDI